LSEFKAKFLKLDYFKVHFKLPDSQIKLILISLRRFSSFMCINIIQREALCQRGMSLASSSSSPVHFSLVKFRGKLDGAAKLDVFPPAAERSADQAHSRGKLCKSLPLIWWRTSWPQEYISRLGVQTAHTQRGAVIHSTVSTGPPPHLRRVIWPVSTRHSLASGSNMCGRVGKAAVCSWRPAGKLACLDWGVVCAFVLFLCMCVRCNLSALIKLIKKDIFLKFIFFYLLSTW